MERKRINSTKRNALLSYLCSTKEHPTAEMLYSEMKKLYPEISQGTVYRNLGVLLEENDVIKVCNVDGKDRYDATTYPHPHFICRSCNRVIDVDSALPFSGAADYISDRYQFTVENTKLEFTGLCDRCSRQVKIS